ncbi:hypothetical protein HBA55_35340 [Pseudomaricurvus alkylphenolicus]|uniref:acyl-CoA thioester hydrolase/BAAT C-terminal domain-containing protein n=1 Tax=Pseudomaricurvus alkylphenolicus TaxID=1306991 RepID=UPI00141ED85D|nr:acyl-CoA thioester hydrolase/BAAT C-terminal domain-containing protein [Pseudomaricurvus alkylphenolicus]NIB44907.1 hypothetical protein [Pseudomaricurvus alkylphenolicus]
MSANKPVLDLGTDRIVMDRSIAPKLIHFPAKSKVDIKAIWVDDVNVAWTSTASFITDEQGSCDLSQATPVAGSYAEPGVDGLFWSMTPDAPEGHAAFKQQGAAPTETGVKRGHRLGLPEVQSDDPHSIQFQARVSGELLAEAELIREFYPASVVETELREGRLRGMLFEPQAVNRPDRGYPGVILISGSGGGIYRQDAAILASHGFSVLALAYFNYEDLSQYQLGVPVEYFREAIDWFRQHLGHDRIGITGPSKGGEGSFIVASYLPDMIKAVVPVVPGDLQLCAVDETGTPHAAWTLEGEPLPWAGTLEDWERVPPELKVPTDGKLFNARMNLEPFYAASDIYERAAIPIERMQCPVLIIWGEDDEAWPSKLAVERATERLKACNYAFDVESFTVPESGHMFTFPGLPTMLSDSILHPLLPINMTMGGTPAGIARLQREGWRKMIDFFRSHLA